VLAHELNRTGAPLWLRDFLRWAREAGRLAADVWYLDSGELVHAFPGVAVAPVLPRWARVGEAALRWALAQNAPALVQTAAALGSRRLLRRGLGRLRRGDAIYVNSAAAAWTIPHLPAGPGIVLHVHEGPAHLEALGAAGGLDHVERAAAVICVSPDAADYLSATARVSRSRISVVPACVRSEQRPTASPATLREILGIAGGTPVAAACGMLQWRKGPDLFVRTVREVLDRWPRDRVQPSFLWIGGGPAEMQRWVRWEARAMGVDGHVAWIDSVPNATDYVRVSDVLVLPSREDPWPLVALEAGCLGLPVAGFRSGGLERMVAFAPECAVPAGACAELAAQLSRMLLDPPYRLRVGDRLRRLVRERWSTEVVAPRVADILDGVLDG
jgi:glycosyltransferase involved in cell wall biosynthesis